MKVKMTGGTDVTYFIFRVASGTDLTTLSSVSGWRQRACVRCGFAPRQP